jgi:hypothetical protein
MAEGYPIFATEILSPTVKSPCMWMQSTKESVSEFRAPGDRTRMKGDLGFLRGDRSFADIAREHPRLR